MKIKTMGDLDKLREAGLKSLAPKQLKISISMSTCGHALGADILYHELVKDLYSSDRKKSQTDNTGYQAKEDHKARIALYHWKRLCFRRTGPRTK
jgi:hypothetical protein